MVWRVIIFWLLTAPLASANYQAYGQTLTWDAFDRLIQVSQRDTNNSGFDFVSIYDGLGRRVRTVETFVTNGIPCTNPASSVSTVDSWYDPQVEFLETAVSVNGIVTVKTYGPDINGVYGGMQGVGGLESLYRTDHFKALGSVQDYFGNVIGTITNGTTVFWNPARFSSYGPVPGYQPLTLSLDTPLEQTVGWHGWRMDPDGCYHIGKRRYSPVEGRFLSADPLGHAASLDLYSYCGGDPVNQFDANGRAVIQAWQQTQQSLILSGGFWNNTAAYGISFGMTALNAFSLGSFGRNDALVDRNLAGQISDGQLYTGMAINSGSATAAVLTGGVAAPAAGGALVASGSPALMYIGSGAAAGLSSSVVDVGLRRMGDAATGIPYYGTVTGDLAYVGESTLAGGVFGGLTYGAVRLGQGVVYLRTDASGNLGDYYGQAQSPERYTVRQDEHAADFPSSQFEFEQVSGASQGDKLDFMEQFYMTANGGARSQNPFTPLSNDIRAMSDARFSDFIFNTTANNGIAGTMTAGALNANHSHCDQ